MLTMYGIKNCDTVKKACAWLTLHNIEFQFHDLRKDGLSEALVQQWLEKLGFAALINKKGTTWRQLADKEKNITHNALALTLMLAKPTLIKRPIVTTNEHIYVGFTPAYYQEIFNADQNRC